MAVSNLHQGVIAGSSGGSTYEIDQSLRFESADNALLSRSPSGSGSLTTWTFSCWVKRGRPYANENSQWFPIITASDGSSTYDAPLYIGDAAGNSGPWNVAIAGQNWTTEQLASDTAAWYHAVVVWDSTNGSAGDRMRLYINGNRVTDFSASGTVTSSMSSRWNSSSYSSHRIGSLNISAGADNKYVFDGYLAEMVFLDGTAVTDASTFGKTDPTTGQWIPIDVSGLTFGTNGFHLDFAGAPGNTVPTAGITPTSSAGTVSGSLSNLSDGDYGNDWRSNVDPATNVSNDWIRYDLGSGNAADIQYVYLDGRATTTGNYKLQYSDNDSDWSDTGTTLSSVQVTTSGKLLDFSADSPGAHRYWRILNISNSVGTSGWGFAEVEFFTTLSQKFGSGADASGNDKHWTESGLAAADQVIDTPTNNFFTLNPLDPHSSDITISEGNLRADMTGSGTGSVFGPLLPATGKWAWKVTATLNMGTGTEYPVIGIVPVNNADLSGPMRSGGTGEGYGADGRFFSASAGSNSSYGNTWADGDVIEVGWDADNGTISFWHNGAAQGAARTGLTGRWKIAQDHYTTAGGDTLTDFGQSGYTPTDTTYKTLCTANLPTPTIADPSGYFQATLYTGNGSTQSINQVSNKDFKPDWVWIKNRDQADNHVITDAVRGVTKILTSHDTDAEATDADTLTAFESDGFALGADDKVNTNTEKYVAWQWLAGNATSTPSGGSVASTVSVNQTSGFSIVSWTGTGANATVAHGLGAIPQVVIVKKRSDTGGWYVGSTDVGFNYEFRLDETGARAGSATIFNETAPTSSVFTVGSAAGSNGSSADMIAYCFAEVEGFSSFGSYTGNGNDLGPFVYTGFKPRWVMIKSFSTESWPILDTARDSGNFGSEAGTGGDNPTAGNDINAVLVGNTNAAEEDNPTGSRKASFVSNGFKVRTTNSAMNTNSQAYFYMAFAESPFKHATGR